MIMNYTENKENTILSKNLTQRKKALINSPKGIIYILT